MYGGPWHVVSAVRFCSQRPLGSGDSRCSSKNMFGCRIHDLGQHNVVLTFVPPRGALSTALIITLSWLLEAMEVHPWSMGHAGQAPRTFLPALHKYSGDPPSPPSCLRNVRGVSGRPCFPIFVRLDWTYGWILYFSFAGRAAHEIAVESVSRAKFC